MKDQTIKFRCSEDEKACIIRMARTAGYGVSEYCRQMALNGLIIEAPKLTPQEVCYFKELIAERQSWKSITNLFKSRSPEFAQRIAEHLERSEFLLNRFY